MRKTAAVIFDMDGVIVDSEKIHARAKMETFRHYGIDFPKEDLPNYVGRSSNELFAEVLAKWKRTDIALDEIIDYKHDAYIRILQTGEIPEVPGATALIKGLHEKEIPLALATSSWEGGMNLVLDSFRIRSCFSSVLSGTRLKESKPSPAIYLKSAQNLGLPPKDCTVVEDSSNGILAAHRAGMQIIAFKNPTSGRQDLHLADIVVERMADILPLIAASWEGTDE
jgi:HAD hydrolase, family IA, variant 3